MIYWKENLAFFKKNSPEIYKKMLSQEPHEFEHECEYDSVKKLFVAKSEGREVYLGSSFDTAREAEMLFSKCDNAASIVVVLGIGNVNLFEKIAKHFKALKRLIIIEPSRKIFNTVMSYLPVKKVFSAFPATNISIVIDADIDSVHLIYRSFVTEEVAAGTAVIIPISYGQLFPFLRKNIIEFADIANEQRAIGINTTDHFRYVWAMNEWNNLDKASTVPEFTLLKPLMEKLPVIIVSAGPSLNKNIHLLEHVKDRAIIIAVGSAMQILKKHNILPHLRMAIDGGPLAKRLFEKVNVDECPLVFSDSLFYDIVEEYKGNAFEVFLHNQSKIKSYIYRLLNLYMPSISSGSSVAIVALFLALSLGCKKIIMMGQDLSFTGNQNYAKGSWTTEKENKNYLSYTPVRKAVDVYGNEVYTELTYLSMKKTFEMAADWAKDVSFINATEGGLKLEGYVSKTFTNVLQNDLYEESFDIRGFIANIKSEFDKKEKLFSEEVLCFITKKIRDEVYAVKAVNKRLRHSLEKKTKEKNLKEVKKHLEKMQSNSFYNLVFKDIFERESLILDSAIASDEPIVRKYALNNFCDALEKYSDFFIDRAEEFLGEKQKRKVVCQL